MTGLWACGRLVTGVGVIVRTGRSRVAAGAWRGSSQWHPGFVRGCRTTAATSTEDGGNLGSATQHIVTSPVPDIPLPSGNAAAYILEKAKQWPDRTAMECSVTGRSFTYAQLVDAVAKWGGQLLGLGLRRGDTLAVMMLNCPEYPVVLLGALSVGVSCTLINSSYTAEEVCRQLHDSGAVMVVEDDHTSRVVEAALALLKKPLPRIANTDSSPPAGVISLRALLQDSSVTFADPVEVGGKEASFIPYSSGTTGKPKGVELSHDAITSNVAMYTRPEFFLPSSPSATQQDTFLCYLPLFHVYGLIVIMSCGLFQGVKIVTMPRFDHNTFIPLIVKHQVTVLHTVPPVLNYLMHSPDVTPSSMASVKNVVCGAAPVSQTAAQNLMDKVDKKLIFQEGYGLTEALITNTNLLKNATLGYCGVILPNLRAKVIDLDTGASQPPKKKGEICFQTPSRMNGYINNEQATREMVDEDGWIHTGDIGFYDQDGNFSIVDRLKELIKVKALQVAPSELEEIILQHPKVREVGVVGVPHDRLGEAPRAYIVTSTPATEEEIHEFVVPRVAPHKQLAGGVVFIKELPKNPTGKILRRQLKQLG